MVEEILELRGADERVAAFLRAIVEPGPLADTIGYAPDVSFEQKVEVLETLDVTERLELAVRIQRERLVELQLRRKIREDVREGADKQQREYFLRKQMESIQRELGEDSGSVVEEYRTKIAEAGMPEAVKEQADQGARAARAHGRAVRRGEHDPLLPRLAHRRAVEASAPTRSSIPCTPARCWTPTTPASRTSRTASSSTWRSRSCASSGASRRTGAPAPSSP